MSEEGKDQEVDYRQLAEDLFRALQLFFHGYNSHAVYCWTDHHEAWEKGEETYVSGSIERCVKTRKVYLYGLEVFGRYASGVDEETDLSLVRRRLAEMQSQVAAKDAQIRRLRADREDADTAGYQQLEADYHALQDAYTRLEERHDQVKSQYEEVVDSPYAKLKQENEELKRMVEGQPKESDAN